MAALHRLSAHISVYGYVVDDGAAAPGHQDRVWPWGASHGVDGAGTGKGEDANHAVLSRQITAEWIGFATTGDPSAPFTPVWDAYTRANPVVMSLAPGGDSVLMPAAIMAQHHHCGFWNSVEAVPER